MRDRDFEILSRYYLREQTAEEICAEMGYSGAIPAPQSRSKRVGGAIRKSWGVALLVDNDDDGS